MSDRVCACVHTGTITLLVIKHDEQTGNYRDKTGILKDYSQLNKLPWVSPLCMPRIS